MIEQDGHKWESSRGGSQCLNCDVLFEAYLARVQLKTNVGCQKGKVK